LTPIVVPEPADWAAFRHTARALIAQRVVPHRVIWSEASSSQMGMLDGSALNNASPLRLPRAFHDAGEHATLHRSHEKWALLYRLIWRILNETKTLLEIAGDEDVARLAALNKAVKRDMHKMTAFVRFKSVPCPDGERYAAFYKPDHFIVKATAPFFARRFPSMRWSILTPDLCVHHDDGQLTYTGGVLHDPLPQGDSQQQLWQTYYASTINPAQRRIEPAGSPSVHTREMREVRESGLAPAPQPIGEPPRLRIGVAGWDYPDWSDVVYSSRAGTDKLRAVAKRFDAIEVNSTFYRPVSPRAAADWVNRVAHLPHFRFTAKLWRRFTHDGGAISQHDVATVRKGFDIILQAQRLVSVVAQFPWSFKRANKQSQQQLIRILNAFNFLPLHVEFRHDSWMSKEVLSILQDLNVGFVNIDQPELPHCVRATSYVTNRIAYVRLHGRNTANWFRDDATRDERFDYLYSEAELLPWKRRVEKIAARNDIDGAHIIFNNHYRAQAVNNAILFRNLLKR
jgi:probable DNA metabolism protein